MKIRTKFSKRQALIALAAMVLFLGTITYAYFTSNVDNTKDQRSDLSMARLALRFADGDNGINTKLDFGESVTKKFTIENTGTAEASLSLDWKNLINTYMNGSLTYRLTYAETEDGEYKEIIPKTNMPVSSEVLTQTMASELSVPTDETYYYNLEITLNSTDVDQTADLSAVFNTSFDVGQPIKYRYYRLQINPNGGEYTGDKDILLKNSETTNISTPTRVGYTFLGWDVQGSSSTLVNNTFTMGISDTYLIAKWTSKTYPLTVNLNDGEYSGTVPTEIKFDEKITLNTPTKTGYTFTGWSTEDGLIENNSFTLTKDKNPTVTANWQINNYKYIVYHNKQNISDSNYTLVGADTDEGEAAYNSTVTPETKPYTGFTPPSQKSLTIQHETVYPPVLNKVDYNYDRNRYTLTINPNGGTYNGSTGESTVSLAYEESVDVNLPGSAQETLSALGITSNGVKSSFDEVATTDEGVFEMADDYGTSYYYRGAVENNYVKFGGFYWRIVRINGDGSIRMIYDGTSAHTNGEEGDENDRFINNGAGVPFNSLGDDAKYVGYMYGPEGATASTSYEQATTNIVSSTVKLTVDNWYKTNIVDAGFSQYVSDQIFCNDRSMPGSYDTKLGYGTNLTHYGARSRVGLDAKSAKPSFVCPQKNDAFTVSDTTKGNGALTFPVGLITVDELSTAGGGKYHNSNSSYYLYRHKTYWSMSPDYFDTSYSGAGIHYSGISLTIGGRTGLDSFSIAPVINIAAEYAKTMTGTGVIGDEYQIPMESKSISAPKKTGYTFTGWNKTSGNGTLTSSTFTMGAGDTKITAGYTPTNYSVTFNANGGTVSTPSKVVTYDSQYGDLPEPTYTGYKFLGWFTEQEGGVQVASTTIYTNPNNTTLYAHWEIAVGATITLNKLGVTVNPGNPTFANAATTNEGVYAMADDYGTSYYYRGAVTNNYVKFANKWWRIIRVNGDGSIRMIYDGTQAYGNGTSNTGRQALTNVKFNTSINDAKYVGYMYGPNGTTASTSYSQATTNTVSSNIKTQVDNWYKTNIVDAGYSQYVSDEIFCNDRSISESPRQWWAEEATANIGYGTNGTAYGAFSRFLTTGNSWSSTPTPKFTCTNKNDAFTVSDTTKGNGALTYPVGLLTVDEINAAGSGKGGTANSSYYLYKGSAYWTLSPRYYRSNAQIFVLNSNTLDSTSPVGTYVNNAPSVAPVINLSPEYSATLKGTGTTTDPFTVS